MEAKGITLTKIIGEKTDYKEIRKEIGFIGINKYVIELIRVSEMYKFELRVRPKAKKYGMPKKEENPAIGIEQEVSKTIKEEKQEINHYIAIKEEFNDDNVSYGDDRVKVKGKDYKYTVKKPNEGYQELWEKTGFYQERPMIAKVKVQLWPEHLPYDHFKRKRAFLFC